MEFPDNPTSDAPASAAVTITSSTKDSSSDATAANAKNAMAATNTLRANLQARNAPRFIFSMFKTQIN